MSAEFLQSDQDKLSEIESKYLIYINKSISDDERIMEYPSISQNMYTQFKKAIFVSRMMSESMDNSYKDFEVKQKVKNFGLLEQEIDCLVLLFENTGNLSIYNDNKYDNFLSGGELGMEDPRSNDDIQAAREAQIAYANSPEGKETALKIQENKKQSIIWHRKQWILTILENYMKLNDDHKIMFFNWLSFDFEGFINEVQLMTSEWVFLDAQENIYTKRQSIFALKIDRPRMGLIKKNLDRISKIKTYLREIKTLHRLAVQRFEQMKDFILKLANSKNIKTSSHNIATITVNIFDSHPDDYEDYKEVLLILKPQPAGGGKSSFFLKGIEFRKSGHFRKRKRTTKRKSRKVKTKKCKSRKGEFFK